MPAPRARSSRSRTRRRCASSLERILSSDEFILDTATVREFVAAVGKAISSASSPEVACDTIRPAFAELLDDPAWLPDEYASDAPDSGMGGGIGQWLLFRAHDGS